MVTAVRQASHCLSQTLHASPSARFVSLVGRLNEEIAELKAGLKTLSVEVEEQRDFVDVLSHKFAADHAALCGKVYHDLDEQKMEFERINAVVVSLEAQKIVEGEDQEATIEMHSREFEALRKLLDMTASETQEVKSQTEILSANVEILNATLKGYVHQSSVSRSLDVDITEQASTDSRLPWELEEEQDESIAEPMSWFPPLKWHNAARMGRHVSRVLGM